MKWIILCRTGGARSLPMRRRLGFEVTADNTGQGHRSLALGRRWIGCARVFLSFIHFSSYDVESSSVETTSHVCILDTFCTFTLFINVETDAENPIRVRPSCSFGRLCVSRLVYTYSRRQMSPPVRVVCFTGGLTDLTGRG